MREWRSGELGVLVLAITVAVAALTGVGFLVDRISIAVDNQAGEVLAADLRLRVRRSPSTTRAIDGSAGAAACRYARKHRPVQRGVQRRRQPADRVAGGVRGVPAARQGDGCRTSPSVPPAHRQRHSGSRRGVAGLAPRGRARRKRRHASSSIGAGKFRVVAHPDQPSRPGRHVPRAGARACS